MHVLPAFLALKPFKVDGEKVKKIKGFHMRLYDDLNVAFSRKASSSKEAHNCTVKVYTYVAALIATLINRRRRSIRKRASSWEIAPSTFRASMFQQVRHH